MKEMILSMVFCLAFLLFSTQQGMAQCEERYSTPIFENVIVTPNVQYGSNVSIGGFDITLKFDFYEPEGDNMAERPLIVFAHGGAFVGGNEDSPDIVQLCNDMAKRGYVCASINYRLIDAFVLPTYEVMIDAVAKAVSDMKSAVRYFRQDAATTNIYRIDPDQIFVGGASAGGFMAVHTAYLDSYDGVPDDVVAVIEENGGLEGDSGNEGYPSNVNGVINLCGALGDVAWMQQGEEPIYSAHGTADGTVPYGHDNIVLFGFNLGIVDGSEAIHQRADDLGIYNMLFTIPGGDHMAHTTGANYPTTLQNITDFLYPLVECESDITGIEDNALSQSIAVYPNPASNKIMVSMDGEVAQNAVLTLYDNMGRIMGQYQPNAVGNLTINRNQLPAGLYHLRLQSGTSMVTKAIVFE